MILAYLGAFGPATIKDVQVWSGLTRLGEVIENLRSSLCIFINEQGTELFDLPNAPRPNSSTPSPPRFLAEYDNILLSHVDRTRIISDEDKKRVFTKNGIIRATVLIDGFVVGLWKIIKKPAEATLIIELFRPILEQDQTALQIEGYDLLKFTAPDTENHLVTMIFQ